LDAWLAEFDYRPAALKGEGLRPSVQRAASELFTTNAEARHDAQKQHAAGVALLVMRRSPEAIPYLERSVSLAPETASYWIDLSAARYESGLPANAPLLMEALTAADRAVDLRPQAPVALFNRALILESLGLRMTAASAWRACMLTDPSSSWGREARHRFAMARSVPRSEQWKHELSRLRRAVSGSDVVAVRRIVDSFRQESRTWGELLILGAWADSYKDDGAAAGHLALARAVGDALRRLTDESLLAEAVVAIDRSSAWNRALLRNAHRAYVKGRVLYRDRRVSDALPLFRSAAAAFRRGKSPMSEVAEYYVANSLHDLGHHAEALALVDALLVRTPKQHIALRAQLLWERGTVLTRTGRLTDALAAQREAEQQFEAMGETINASYMINAIASSLSFLGRRDEAWALRQKLFEQISRAGDMLLLQTVLDSTARTEALAQHWPEAFSLLTLSVDPKVRMSSRVAATSFLWRALAGARLGLATGLADVNAARLTARAVADPILRRNVMNEADFTEAILHASRDPHDAERRLTRYIDVGLEACDAYLLPEACLARARLRHDEGDDVGAIADLKEASWWLDQRRNDASDEYRDAYFPTSDSVRRELVDVLCHRGEDWQAFLAAAEPIDRAETPANQAAALAVIPTDTLVVRYVVLPRRLVIFVLSTQTFTTIAVPVSRETLASVLAELVAAILADRPSDIRASGQRLAEWLLRPMSSRLRNARRLVVLSDDPLDPVPFATLPYGPDRSPLITSVELVFRSTFSSRERDQGSPSRARSVLAIGNPRFDASIFPALAQLGAAEGEARRVAALYGQRQVLTGEAATPGAVIAGLKRAGVADFATHAILAPDAPSRSFLVLATSHNESGTLNLDEIAKLPLGSLRLVVLAGCRTAAPTASGGTATSVAQAFTRAGAHDVIGNLWYMNDYVASSWSIALHRDILAGMTPAEALRQTQIAMLHSHDPVVRLYRSWGGLRLYSR
jgi:CHAT domain-containing protein